MKTRDHDPADSGRPGTGGEPANGRVSAQASVVPPVSWPVARAEGDTLTGTEDIGRRIRAIRRDERLSIEEVAARSGLSRVSVSRIESGAVNPSVTTLRSIADALGVFIGSFFIDAPTGTEGTERGITPPALTAFTLVRRDRRKHVDAVWANWYLDMLTPDAHRRINAGIVIQERGQPYWHETHDGEEFMVVLEGTCDLDTGAHSGIHRLEEGDCFYLLRPPAFEIRTVGERPVRTLWVAFLPSTEAGHAEEPANPGPGPVVGA